MDLKKIRVRQDLERMLINYRIREDITADQCASICDFIDKTIGGGDLSQPVQSRRGPGIIPFPTQYAGATPQLSEDEKIKQATLKRALSEIYAPYGELLPPGVDDFRHFLQRDGLILICYQKLVSREGTFFDILWARSCSGNDRQARITEWSGTVRVENIPYAMPLDGEYSNNYHEEAALIYTVYVAPDNILKGPLSDYLTYVKSLKTQGVRNAAGEKINFDYVFNFGAEKRNRYLKKNEELIALKLPIRIVNALNDRGIYKAKDIKKITVRELQSLRSVGQTILSQTLARLKEAGITLQEEKCEEENTDGQMSLDF